MKQLSPLLTLCLLALLFNTSCRKKDIAPIDQLPAITMEGKNTFGCLVNGKAFKPKGFLFSGPTYGSFYQLVDGEYHFMVKGVRYGSEGCGLSSIKLFNDGSTIEQGGVYNLKTRTRSSSASAIYSAPDPGCMNIDQYYINQYYETNEVTLGELRITHFDIEKQIVSGTFWFDAVNSKGEKVEVREGRFDMQFIR